MRVSRKGQVVIPVEIRRKFGIGRRVSFIDRGDEVVLVPVKGLEEAFGAGGRVMIEVAKEIGAARREEAELESASSA